MKRRSDEATKRRRGGTGNLPVSNFRDPRSYFLEPRTIEGFRGERIDVGYAVWLAGDECWHVIWPGGAQIFVPSIDQVLSRLVAAGADTITIERSRSRS